MATFIRVQTSTGDQVLVNLDNVRYCRSSSSAPGRTAFFFDDNQSLTLDINIDMVESLAKNR